MRIVNTIKNSLYALISYVLIAVITLITRKVFLDTLPVELLGYEGLFGNLFAIITLTDLGIESLILYRLFPAFARNDEKRINAILNAYKLLYRFVGTAVLVIGLILIPFLHLIVKDSVVEWNYVYTIYLLQLASTLCTYFLAYKRLMFSVNQQEYECTKVDTAVSFSVNFSRLLVLILFKSYILYLLCGLIGNILGNVVISRKVDRKFEFLDLKKKTTVQDIKALNIGSELKYNSIQKICFVLYGSTDNIVVSYLFGIAQTGLLANYMLIQSYVTNLLTKLLKPFQMAIGNYVYAEDIEQGKKLFEMLDFISFFLASIIGVCYLNLFNPTIELMFGSRYLLSIGFVAAFVANQYIMWNHQFLTYYRYSFGKYELDTMPFLLAAILNIALSIVLGKMIGIAGVMIGTSVGHFGIWVGRAKVVFNEYLHNGKGTYIKKQILRLALFLAQLFITYYICSDMIISVGGLALRLVICITLPAIINIIVYSKTSEMKSTVEYVKKVLSILREKTTLPKRQK